jgi:hypothetical protein
MSSVLSDVQYIPQKDSFKRRKKTQKKLGLSLDTLDDFCHKYQLSTWERDLVKAIDIDKMNFSTIARSTGCSRQYVSQEYSRVFSKVMDLGYKASDA